MIRIHKDSRGIAVSLIVFVCSIVFVQPAQAQSIITDGRVPVGQDIDNDIIIFGDDVVIEGNVNGDVIAIGSNIYIIGDIAGSLITVGNEISINSNVGGSVYSAGVNISLASNSDISRNLYFAGMRIETAEESQIGWDMVAAALRAQLAGSVGRDFKAIIGLLEFADIIREGVKDTIPEEIQPTEDSQENQESQGVLLFPSNRTSFLTSHRLISFIDESTGRRIHQGTEQSELFNPVETTGSVDTDKLLQWLAERGRIFLAFLVVGGLVAWLLPDWLTKWADSLKESTWYSAGYGILGLIVALNGFIIAAVLAVAFLAIGLGLGAITLWRLAFYFWGLSFSSLGFVLTLYALFVFYVSKIIVAYLSGRFILERITKDAAQYKILSLLIGITILVLLTGLPYVGWVISLIITVLGLGAAYLTFREYRAEKKPA